MITDGKYKALKPIHVFSCTMGQLYIPAGTVMEITKGGKLGIADGIKFPGCILEFCRGNIEKMNL